jgi:hypothetical protein
VLERLEVGGGKLYGSYYRRCLVEGGVGVVIISTMLEKARNHQGDEFRKNAAMIVANMPM